MKNLPQMYLRYDHKRMPVQPIHDPTQFLTLRAFTTLHQLRSAWGGALILSLGLSREAAALSIASSIAGAVSITIDDDPANLREASRTGAVDFVVNNLDEAIRAMKNEVRKRTPLAVALSTDPARTLNEILERGLAPQLFSTFVPLQASISQAAEILHTQGSALIDFSESTQTKPGFEPSRSILAPFLDRNGWAAETFTFETSAALRDFDTRASALLKPEDTIRRRWLELVPRLLQRQRPPHRTLWLSAQERSNLERASA
jgi:urocanate hydratase